MTTQTFGPADLYVVAFADEHVPAAVRDSLLDALSSGVITLLDLVVVRRSLDGSTEIIELENLVDELELTMVEAPGTGLVGQEDIDELMADVEPGTSLLVILFENTWARAIATAVSDSGGQVIAADRVPADVVNEIAELSGVVQGA